MANELVNYGIQNEESHIRAHVCPRVKRIYVFPTASGIEALKAGEFKVAYQPGVEGHTGEGKAVPIWRIKRMVSLELNPRTWQIYEFSQDMSTSEKGALAVRLVKALIETALFPLPIGGGNAADALAQSVEVAGTDIIVTIGASHCRVQVKCDWSGGDAVLGGTGNVFLQTAERNPLGRT